MRTLFVPMPGFFPKRHQTFIRMLSKHFKLIVHEDYQWDISGPNIQNTTQLVTQIGNVERLDEFKVQWNTYRAYMKKKATEILGREPTKALIDEHFESLRPTLSESLKRALVLSEIVKEQPVDMLVSGADYIHYNRPFTFTAARANIPSVHIEHGLLGLSPYPVNAAIERRIKFGSNYVILDNELEVDIYSKFRRQENVRELLPLGAPLDNSVAQSNISETDAKCALNIPPQKKCILAVLSWSEPATPLAPVKNQTLEMTYIKTILRAWQKYSRRSDVHLILKCHPAIADFGQYDGYKKYLRYLASEYGMTSNITIIDKNLDEAVAASSMIVSWRRSSVLWDAMMRGKQTVLWLEPNGEGGSTANPAPPPRIAVVDAGLCDYIKTDDDLVGLFSKMFDDNATARFSQNLSQFKQQWRLTPRSAEEKSQRIIDWMKTKLK